MDSRALEQLYRTALQFDTVKRVELHVDGKLGDLCKIFPGEDIPCIGRYMVRDK